MKTARIVAFPVWIFRFPIPLVATILLLATLGDQGRLSLRYEREAVFAGDIWRLLTSHLVHLDNKHLTLNIVGLILLPFIFYQRSQIHWWVDSLSCGLVVSLGLVWLNPEVSWYVGFSGILHGLLFAALLEEFGHYPRSTLLLIFALVAKLIWEQVMGPFPATANLISGDIVLDAHLYGAVCGALLFILRRRGSSPNV